MDLSNNLERPEGYSFMKHQATSEYMARQQTALPWGFLPLRRLQTQAATNTEVTTLGCATPPGFLNLLTSFSACALSALFRAESVNGVEALRGFPSPVAATAFTALCPFSHMHNFYEKCS